MRPAREGAGLHWIAMVVALAAGACAIAFAWQPGLATFHDDSVSYLLMAQAFSPWHAVSPAVAAAWPHEKYPPLFPALIALAGAAYDWRWAHAIVAACFGASVWLLGAHAARITASARVGLAVALVYALLPGAWLNMKGVLSEFPYMALAFAALVAHRRFAEDPRLSRAGLLAVLLAGAMLTRTIGIALWLAFAIVELAAWIGLRERQRARRAGWLLGASLAALASWYALRPAGGDDAYVQFGTQVAGRVATQGPGWLLGLMASNLGAIFDAWLNALVIYWGEATQPKFLLCAALGMAGLGAIAWRALRFEADGVYVIAFLGILAAWPFPGQMYRLALPVLPLLLCAIAWAAAQLLRGRLDAAAVKRGAAYVGLIPLAFCVPALFYIAQRANAGAQSSPGVQAIMEYYRIPFRPAAEAEAQLQLRAFADMERIRAATREGDRVMGYGPAYIALLAQRHGVPLDPPADADNLERQIRAGQADYVYLSTVNPRDSAHRLGNPLMPAVHLATRAHAVWQRTGPDGNVEAALFDVRALRGERRP
jgi:hypothetical protein